MNATKFAVKFDLEACDLNSKKMLTTNTTLFIMNMTDKLVNECIQSKGFKFLDEIIQSLSRFLITIKFDTAILNSLTEVGSSIFIILNINI